MRERITRFGAGGGAYDSADHSANLEDEEEEDHLFRNDHGH